MSFLDDLTARLAANMRHGTKDMGDAPHVRKIAEYIDLERFAREQQVLFRGLPIIVAHSSQIAKPGDFITHDLLGPPLIITRTEAGAAAAYLNVCRHRSALVELEACGNRNSFTCPYHNWIYGLDGGLIATPDPASFAGLDYTKLGLRPVAVAEKYGLIFVRLAEGPPIDLDVFLGPVGEELAAFDIPGHAFFRERFTPLTCNWKVSMEGSLETYHFHYVHGKTTTGQFAPMSNVYDHFAPHQRYVMARKKLVQNLEQGADARSRVLPNYHIFPNTVLTFPHDHLTITQVFPRGIGESVFHNVLLTRGPAASPESVAYWERALTLTEAVNDEDFAVLQGVQKTYDTAPQEQVIHGRYEQGITDFHIACDTVLARG